MLRSTALAAAMLGLFLVVPVAAAAPPAETASDAAATSHAPVVGIMRFAGDLTIGEELRTELRGALDAAGVVHRGFILDIDAAARRARCRRGVEACLGRIAASLRKNAWGRAQPLDLVITGTVAGAGALSRIVVHEVRTGATIAAFEFHPNPHDLILKIAVARAVVAAIVALERPPAPITAEERQILGALDRDPPIERARPDGRSRAVGR